MNNSLLFTGVFADYIQGITYETPTFSGITNEKGEFKYARNESVTFSIGNLVLGTALGCELVTPAHLVYSVGGDIRKLKNQKVTNLARFIQSLCGKPHLESGFVITDDMKTIINQFTINFDLTEDMFTNDQAVQTLMKELNLTLRSPEHARNHLRRSLNGIKKMTDVKVPTRDGSYLLADVFIPIKKGKYPVVMNHTGYGKAFWFGCIRNEDEFQEHERMEDDYFEGIKRVTPFIDFHLELAGESLPPQLPPGGTPMNPYLEHVSEGFEIANTLDWVPDGYVVIRVDGRGTGNTPGLHNQFSLQEAQDYYDAIEWAATQSWSDGNIGLYGASYYAMNMYSVASLQPPHLKAMIPIGGDLDYYRDVIYSGGGLYTPFNFIAKHSCSEWQGIDFVNITKGQPFDNPDECPCYSPDPKNITVPFWSSMPIESPGIHTRGSSEAFIHSASKDKKLMLNSEVGVHYWMYTPEILSQHKAFFAFWLKGEQNGIMEEAPVKLFIRSGHHGYYWQNEQDWPVARTNYKKLYLNADDKTLNDDIPTAESNVSYQADVPMGLTFVTAPMRIDTVVAGYFKLATWCSSTSNDMAVKAVIRVLDENDIEVPYDVQLTYPKNPAVIDTFPVAQGSLKVSHRKIDPIKSTIYRPYHTHLENDYQPLCDGEIVECEIEIWPSTARIKKGWKIRLDIQPAQDILDSTYQQDAMNTIYTGSKFPSYLQIPVITKL